MNRTQKFLMNSFSTGLLQIVTMITGMITPRIMLTVYGSEINGLVSSITQFISYFNLVEAGLSGAAIYALYEPLAQNNHKRINGVISAAKKFYTQSGYIFVSLTLGLAFLYPAFVKSDGLSPLLVGVLVLILGMKGCLEFFTLSKYRVLLSADQKTYVISVASIVQIVLNTVIIVVLARYRVNIVLLRFIALFSVFARSAILLLYCKKRYRYLNYNEIPDKTALNKRWDALYIQILGAVHVGTPTVLITFLLKNLKLVSVYSIYNMIISSLNKIASIFISGLSASFGDIIARKEWDILKRSYREFEFTYYMIISVIYSTALITIMSFINIYTKGVSDINYNVPLLGFIFVLDGVLYNLKTPQGMLVISAGMYRETRWQTTLQGIIAILAGAILSFKFGIIGILIGSVLSNLYRVIDLLFFVPKNITKTSVKSSLFKMARVFMCIILTWIPFNFINYNPATLISWFFYAIIVVIFALIVTCAINFVFDKNDFLNVSKRVIRLRVKR